MQCHDNDQQRDYQAVIPPRVYQNQKARRYLHGEELHLIMEYPSFVPSLQHHHDQRYATRDCNWDTQRVTCFVPTPESSCIIPL